MAFAGTRLFFRVEGIDEMRKSINVAHELYTHVNIPYRVVRQFGNTGGTALGNCGDMALRRVVVSVSTS